MKRIVIQPSTFYYLCCPGELAVSEKRGGPLKEQPGDAVLEVRKNRQSSGVRQQFGTPEPNKIGKGGSDQFQVGHVQKRRVGICCNASRESVNAGSYGGIQFNVYVAAAGLRGRGR
ncbi:hypothetical protein UIA24_21770 [Pseudomonas sp. AL 58]|uniref:hypothetical protein n=1 Tax=Pseudomonas sp. AL 58 TaxID=3104275 RepID=UPI002EB55B5B|nr:hypothetical protein [Pseudomonas sp. AL 58]